VLLALIGSLAFALPLAILWKQRDGRNGDASRDRYATP